MRQKHQLTVAGLESVLVLVVHGGGGVAAAVAVAGRGREGRGGRRQAAAVAAVVEAGRQLAVAAGVVRRHRGRAVTVLARFSVGKRLVLLRLNRDVTFAKPS